MHNYGSAIPVTERKRIFEPLVRGIADQYKIPGGLGLGLYICKLIIERVHSGTIEPEYSQEKRVAVFRLRFPLWRYNR